MPREHSSISMTEEEVVSFLAAQSHCVVASLDADGTPWGDVAACAYQDGLLYFRPPAGSRTERNVRADGRVCCTLESKGADYYTIRAAMVHGVASPIGGDHAVAASLDTRADPLTKAPAPGSIFAVDLGNVVSFDFAKIQRRFEQ